MPHLNNLSMDTLTVQCPQKMPIKFHVNIYQCMHLKVNNGRRQDSVGMDSSEAVYDMNETDDDNNFYSLVDTLN